MADTNKERVEKIDEKLSKLKAQKQAILKREKEQARKDRTRRLIQYGALAEKYFDCSGASPEEFENILKNHFTALQDKREEII